MEEAVSIQSSQKLFLYKGRFLTKSDLAAKDYKWRHWFSMDLQIIQHFGSWSDQDFYDHKML